MFYAHLSFFLLFLILRILQKYLLYIRGGKEEGDMGGIAPFLNK